MSDQDHWYLFIQLSQNKACHHPTASKECIGVCLGEGIKTDSEEVFNPLQRVIELLELLPGMGVQLNGAMKVWWPFTVVPRAYAIKDKQVAPNGKI